MPSDPMWINYDQASGAPLLDADEARRNMALAMMWDGRAVGARQGVRPGGTQLQVSLAGSTITVQPGTYLVDPALTATQGPYWASVPAAENPVGGPLAAADATNPRRDIVVARVYDHDMDASGKRYTQTEYRAGVASPTPSAPQVQAGEVLLATIDVPRSGNGAPVVTNVYTFTVASGGLLPVRSKAERDAITPYAYNGMSIWRMDLKWEEVFDGAGWRVQGTAVVAAFADLAGLITSPYNGQFALVTGEGPSGRLYRYNATVPEWRVQGPYRDKRTLTAAAASISFDIPSYLSTVTVTLTGRGDAPGKGVDVQWRVNSVTTNSYLTTRSYVVDNSPGVFTTGLNGSAQLGSMAAAASPANRWGSMSATLTGWDNPHPGALTANGQGGYTDTGTNNILVHHTGVYLGNGPFTKLTLLPLTGNFVNGTQATITAHE